MSTATETNRPKIQIDDLVREMTDEEYADYLARSIVEPLGTSTPVELTQEQIEEQANAAVVDE